MDVLHKQVAPGATGSDKDEHYESACPCRSTLDLLSSKWTALVIGALEERTHRFGELQRVLPGVSKKMLAQTLRVLEADGLISRTVHAEAPIRVEYTLTELGRSAAIPLAAVREWSMKHAKSIDRARRDHAKRTGIPAP
ncbi:helix-turn-helix domain-containing protein [Glycomyces sp. NPDC021274]|uniref:winged helix-turn-helix transcriptional regulator n=1 Tax=Glycomyces sp. NPDC021274 TaxID=3155120 RepID=UPI0033C98A3F